MRTRSASESAREAGVKIRGVAGTSVGALNGALICMDDLEKAEEIWGTMTYPRYSGWMIP
ncbi:MAG: hypothetical protein ACLUAR_16610 [Pilosibacter sp.]